MDGVAFDDVVELLLAARSADAPLVLGALTRMVGAAGARVAFF